MTDVFRNSSTFNGEPPFSLDLTGVDPDIVYSVEVYNITCGRSLLISECDVMETSYTNNALLPGYIYEYIVTPRSNVEGAKNGTPSQPLRGGGSRSYMYTTYQVTTTTLSFNNNVII